MMFRSTRGFQRDLSVYHVGMCCKIHFALAGACHMEGVQTNHAVYQRWAFQCVKEINLNSLMSTIQMYPK